MCKFTGLRNKPAWGNENIEIIAELNIEHRNGLKRKILHLQSIFLLTGTYGQNEMGNHIVMDFVNPIVHPTQNTLFLVRSFRRFALALINLTTTSDIVCKVISEIVTQLFTWKNQRVKNPPNTLSCFQKVNLHTISVLFAQENFFFIY